MNLQADASSSVSLQIQRAITAALNELPLGMRWWVRAHLIEPRSVELCTSADTGTHATFWLVTDHVGLDDAPFRIVFGGSAFGLEITLEDGVSYLVHRSASFAEAVASL
jgi:hypothetical protein